ncbi:MAG: hypothetical protein ACOX52_15285 [Verrucomicrobiota bacterium]
MEPTHPDRLVENATAPSAGGFPGPDGEVRLRMRLPFRMTSCEHLVGGGKLSTSVGVFGCSVGKGRKDEISMVQGDGCASGDGELIGADGATGCGDYGFGSRGPPRKTDRGTS